VGKEARPKLNFCTSALAPCRNVRKLKGYDPDTWRYRIGSCRFFYEIDDKENVVAMIAATHRGSAYR